MTTPERPRPFIEGLIPTLNHRGFMSEKLDPFSARFVDHAATLRSEVLDLGCAYGVATIAALRRGARVHACDMEARHLEILVQDTPVELRGHLRTSVGILPEADFPEGAFGAILCARVVHFLLPAELRTSLQKMRRWLTPGGRLFLIADTPYTGFWFSGAPEYERRKDAGEEWPGFIPDVAVFMKDGERPPGMLPHLNPLDPDILARECERAGFEIEEAAFTGRDLDNPVGRNHAAVIARRPA
jgi:SAM-dependent methyltransferase